MYEVFADDYAAITSRFTSHQIILFVHEGLASVVSTFNNGPTQLLLSPLLLWVAEVLLALLFIERTSTYEHSKQSKRPTLFK